MKHEHKQQMFSHLILVILLCCGAETVTAAANQNHTTTGTCKFVEAPHPTCAYEDGSIRASIRYTKPAITQNGINIDNPHTAFGTKDPLVFASQHGSVPRTLLPRDIAEQASTLENDLEPVWVNIHNARSRNFTLLKDGFQLVTVTEADRIGGILPAVHKGADARLLDDYLRTIERMAVRITGAKAAYVYNNFTWRSLSADEMNYGDYAHTDVGRYSWCASSLDDTSQWPPQLQRIAATTSMLSNVTKFAAATVWRLLQSDQEQSHLGFLHHGSLREGDMVNFTMLAANDTFGSNYRLKYQEKTDHHRWYYYPNLDKDRELLFFLAHDSTQNVLPIVHSQVHAAFQARIDPQAPSRRSVDSRLLLVFE